MDVRLGLATINSIKGNPCCSRSLPGGIAHHVPQVLTKKKMNLPLCRLSDTLHYVTTHRYRIRYLVSGIWYRTMGHTPLLVRSRLQRSTRDRFDQLADALSMK